MARSRRRVFVSYRRADSAGHAGRLEVDLTRLLGNRIFRDVSDITPGAEFPKVLRSELDACGAVLAVIGPQWRRILDERPADQDYVRVELREALAHDGAIVIPVLVNGATLPGRDDLPDDLKPLADRQALALRDDRWDDDVANLAARLRTTLGIRRWPVWPLATAAVGLALLGLWALRLPTEGGPYDRARAHELVLDATRKAANTCRGRAGNAGMCPLAYRFAPDGTVSQVWYDAGWCDFKGSDFGDCLLDRLRSIHIRPFDDLDSVEIGFDVVRDDAGTVTINE